MTLDDIDFHRHLFSDPTVVRFLYDDVIDEGHLLEHLTGRIWTGPPTDGHFSNLGVERNGELIGEIGIGLRSESHRVGEIGYVFSPLVAREGYATEAARVATDLAFVLLDCERVEGRLDARNVASARLLERLGFTFEGTLRQNEWVKGERTDETIYGVLREEWTVTTDVR